MFSYIYIYALTNYTVTSLLSILNPRNRRTKTTLSTSAPAINALFNKRLLSKREISRLALRDSHSTLIIRASSCRSSSSRALSLSLKRLELLFRLVLAGELCDSGSSIATDAFLTKIWGLFGLQFTLCGTLKSMGPLVSCFANIQYSESCSGSLGVPRCCPSGTLVTDGALSASDNIFRTTASRTNLFRRHKISRWLNTFQRPSEARTSILSSCLNFSARNLGLLMTHTFSLQSPWFPRPRVVARTPFTSAHFSVFTMTPRLPRTRVRSFRLYKSWADVTSFRVLFSLNNKPLRLPSFATYNVSWTRRHVTAEQPLHRVLGCSPSAMSCIRSILR